MNEGWDGILLVSGGKIVLCSELEIVWPYSGNDLRVPILEYDTSSSRTVKLASQQRAK